MLQNNSIPNRKCSLSQSASQSFKGIHVYDEWWDNGFHVYYVIQYCFFDQNRSDFFSVLFLHRIKPAHKPFVIIFPVRFHRLRLHYVHLVQNESKSLLFLSFMHKFSFVSNFNLASLLMLFISMAMSTWYRRCQLISGIEFILFFDLIKSRKPTHKISIQN